MTYIVITNHNGRIDSIDCYKVVKARPSEMFSTCMDEEDLIAVLEVDDVITFLRREKLIPREGGFKSRLLHELCEINKNLASVDTSIQTVGINVGGHQ